MRAPSRLRDRHQTSVETTLNLPPHRFLTGRAQGRRSRVWLPEPSALPASYRQLKLVPRRLGDASIAFSVADTCVQRAWNAPANVNGRDTWPHASVPLPFAKLSGARRYHNFCSGILRTPSFFPASWCSKTVPGKMGQQYLAVTDRRYSIADERSRARKGADGRIPAEKPGLHNPHRRAVDCAPYLTLYASGVKDWKRSFWSAVLQHRFRFD